MAHTFKTREQRNLDFTVHLNDDGTWPREVITIALLNDIRAELQALNNTLSCYRVRRMSDDINRIDKRLREHGLLAIKRKK